MSFSRYESYKDSGVEWLGEVPEHWDVRAIKHIVSIPITDGPHETPNFPDEGIPFVSAEAVSTGVIDFSKIRGFISESDHFRYSQKYLPQVGDIYMVKSGATTGITAIVEVDREFNIWSPLAAIRCGKRAIPRFILNFMRSKNFQEAVTLNWSFGTQQNIGMGVIENLAVTLPPIPEQQTIAAFLDRETAKIDALIAEQQQLIELLKEKRQSVISHAVTKGLNPNAPMKDSGIEWLGDVPEHWEVKPIKSVSSCNDDVFDEKTPADYEIEYVEISGVDADRGISETVIVLFGDAPSRARRRVKKGDVIVSTVRTYLRAIAAVNNPPDNMVVSTGFAVVRPRLIQSQFLGYLFHAEFLISEVIARSVGVSYPAINASELMRLDVPVPPISEQQTIATFLDRETTKLDTLTTEAKTATTLLLERRTALISAAVTGKIDVRGLVFLA